LRALIVDDSRFFRETFKTRLLERFPSMVIHEAINGKEAMEKINRSPPHLIFMDICSAILTGFSMRERQGMFREGRYAMSTL